MFNLFYICTNLLRVDQVFQQVARLALQQEEAEAEQSTTYVSSSYSNKTFDLIFILLDFNTLE